MSPSTNYSSMNTHRGVPDSSSFLKPNVRCRKQHACDQQSGDIRFISKLKTAQPNTNKRIENYMFPQIQSDSLAHVRLTDQTLGQQHFERLLTANWRASSGRYAVDASDHHAHGC
eukprot:764928-Hanusia_phi.AAC.1